MNEVIDALGILILTGYVLLIALSGVLWAADKIWSALRHKL